MIEAVLLFGLITAAFETVLLLKLPPRWRLRLLGSPICVGILHALVIAINLAIHWGTMTGSMTAVVAGLTSFATVPLVRAYCGAIHSGIYLPGYKRYDLSSLR